MSSESFQAPDPSTDVVEICTLLQCLGFSVKSMDTSDANLSQDGGIRTVVINCQSSGLNVVLEGASALCSCPPSSDQNSSFWQISAVSQGKKHDQETGSNLLRSLPKSLRDRLTKDLSDLVRCIKSHSDEASGVVPSDVVTNKSASMAELNTTPEKRHLQIKADTPTRYRSLDTLTNTKEVGEPPLPAPGALCKHVDTSDEGITSEHLKKLMCRRQSTYTVASTPGSSTSSKRHRSKTSSPIQQSVSLLDNLIAAEKAAEDLRNKLATIVKDFADEKMDSSMSSLALDVSKISILKGTENIKTQFASSPNLSGLGTVHEDRTRGRFKRYDSASTSNLASRKATPGKEEISKTSRLKRLSPNFFRLKKDSPKDLKVEGKLTKFNSLIRPRIVTPVRVPKTATPEPSPNMSASKKKYSHIKSTIPRATSKKE